LAWQGTARGIAARVLLFGWGIAVAETAAAIGRIVWFMRSRRVRDYFAPERDGRI